MSDEKDWVVYEHLPYFKNEEDEWKYHMKVLKHMLEKSEPLPKSISDAISEEFWDLL